MTIDLLSVIYSFRPVRYDIHNSAEKRKEGGNKMFSTGVGAPEPTYRVGIDIGGTSVKCGIIDSDNNIA